MRLVDLKEIELKTTLPDDRVEDDVDIILPGGQAATIAIARLLRGAGFQTESLDLDLYDGWRFSAEKEGWGFSLAVKDGADFLLVAISQWRLPKASPDPEASLDTICRLISEDPRFYDVQ